MDQNEEVCILINGTECELLNRSSHIHRFEYISRSFVFPWIHGRDFAIPDQCAMCYLFEREACPNKFHLGSNWSLCTDEMKQSQSDNSRRKLISQISVIENHYSIQDIKMCILICGKIDQLVNMNPHIDCSSMCECFIYISGVLLTFVMLRWNPVGLYFYIDSTIALRNKFTTFCMELCLIFHVEISVFQPMFKFIDSS